MTLKSKDIITKPNNFAVRTIRTVQLSPVKTGK